MCLGTARFSASSVRCVCRLTFASRCPALFFLLQQNKQKGISLNVPLTQPPLVFFFPSLPHTHHTQTHTHTHAHMQTHAHMHTHANTCTHTHMHTCTHIHSGRAVYLGRHVRERLHRIPRAFPHARRHWRAVLPAGIRQRHTPGARVTVRNRCANRNIRSPMCRPCILLPRAVRVCTSNPDLKPHVQGDQAVRRRRV